MEEKRVSACWFSPHVTAVIAQAEARSRQLHPDLLYEWPVPSPTAFPTPSARSCTADGTARTESNTESTGGSLTHCATYDLSHRTKDKNTIVENFKYNIGSCTVLDKLMSQIRKILLNNLLPGC